MPRFLIPRPPRPSRLRKSVPLWVMWLIVKIRRRIQPIVSVLQVFFVEDPWAVLSWLGYRTGTPIKHKPQKYPLIEIPGISDEDGVSEVMTTASVVAEVKVRPGKLPVRFPKTVVVDTRVVGKVVDTQATDADVEEYDLEGKHLEGK